MIVIAVLHCTVIVQQNCQNISRNTRNIVYVKGCHKRSNTFVRGYTATGDKRYFMSDAIPIRNS